MKSEVGIFFMLQHENVRLTKYLWVLIHSLLAKTLLLNYLSDLRTSRVIFCSLTLSHFEICGI